jgi:hypothetical protein
VACDTIGDASTAHEVLLGPAKTWYDAHPHFLGHGQADGLNLECIDPRLFDMDVAAELACLPASVYSEDDTNRMLFETYLVQHLTQLCEQLTATTSVSDDSGSATSHSYDESASRDGDSDTPYSSLASTPPPANTGPDISESRLVGCLDIHTLNKKASRTCSNCSTQSTCIWRRDLQGRTLCDACGQYLKLNGVARPASRFHPYRRRVNYGPSQQTSTPCHQLVRDNTCSNCFTKGPTNCWRTGPKGERLCNACGQFLKRYGAARPQKHTLRFKKPLCKRYHRSGRDVSSRSPQEELTSCRRRLSSGSEDSAPEKRRRLVSDSPRRYSSTPEA